MSHRYCIRTGDWTHNGAFLWRGYSGHGDGKNNPDKCAERAHGPIPVGAWAIAGPPENSPTHGPFVLRLEPLDSTETFGRFGFLVHGDSKSDPGNASLGCIILPEKVRREIWVSGDPLLEVVAEPLGPEEITPLVPGPFPQS